jgi:tRNA(fMet)-specific endonuclease VapC
MYLLDTDHMTILERESPEAQRLKARLAEIPPDDLATTIVSYEEQTRGWLAVSAQARTADALIAAYRRLKTHLQIYCKIAVVDYDENAAAAFERFRQSRIRIATMDLRIAAIALANNAVLLTRNLTDFGKVPGLRAEDWSS